MTKEENFILHMHTTSLVNIPGSTTSSLTVISFFMVLQENHVQLFQ